jgi:hypothetical protein
LVFGGSFVRIILTKLCNKLVMPCSKIGLMQNRRASRAVTFL